MNRTGKKIVAKIAAVVAVSGSVFALSATSATALPLTSEAHDDCTYMSVSGDRNGWSVNGSRYDHCPKRIFFGHFDLTFPNGKKVIGSDSANPKLLMAGTGAGKVTVTGYERVSPGNYKMMGEPSLDIP
jgi:hypothetical protein